MKTFFLIVKDRFQDIYAFRENFKNYLANF